MHLPTNTILRVVSRYFKTDINRNAKNEVIYIKPQQFFISYKFLPSMDGTFYGLGFGTLLESLNWSVNNILNSLIDAGSLANLQTGMIGKGLRIKKKNMRMRPGEMMFLDSSPGVKIRDNIQMLDFKEPSTTLFSLLGLLIDVSKNLSSTTDLLQGNQLAQNAPATSVLALIEQGTKVFSAIQKRLFTSLKREFELVYDLNRVFVDPNQYASFLNVPVEQVSTEDGFVSDFEELSLDIKPVADPTISSDAQRLAQNQAVLDLALQGAIPLQPAVQRYLEGLRIPNPEQLFPQEPEGPSMEEQELELKRAKEQANFDIRDRSLQLKEADQELKRVQVESQAIKNIAEAEAAEAGIQVDQYRATIEDIKTTADAINTLRGDSNEGGSDRRVEPTSGNDKA
jgi:hypothetical protein